MANLKKFAEKFGLEALEALGKSKSVAGEVLEKGGKALSYPQKKLAQAAAQKLGLPVANNSEESFANIADLLVNKVVPENSDIVGPALKAGLTAGAEVFADPLMALGKLGKLKKLGAMAGIVKKEGNLGKAGLKAEKLIAEGAPVVQKVGDATKTIAGQVGLHAKEVQARAAKQIPKIALAPQQMSALEKEATEKASELFGKEAAAARIAGAPNKQQEVAQRIKSFINLYIKGSGG